MLTASHIITMIDYMIYDIYNKTGLMDREKKTPK